MTFQTGAVQADAGDVRTERLIRQLRSEYKRRTSKQRRETRKAEGRCINDTIARTHGLPVGGHVRCAACIATHARSR